MLAASAILYFSQRAKEARNDANALADSVNDLSSKFQTMSHTELAATIGKLSQSLPELSDAVSDAQKEFNDATSAVQRQQREIANWGTNTTRGRQAAEALSGAQDNLAIATLELEKAQNRLSQTQNAINIGRATLNGTMKQGIDLLRRDGQEAGIAAGMMSKLGDMINFAAKAKDKFNSSSLMVERPKDVQEYLDKLQDQVTLQSELNDRKRAQLRAEQDIRKLGGSEADVNLARDRAAAEFDAQQAQQNNKKATKEAESEAKKLANQQESVNQKLENLRQQSELAAGSTQELSREKAILNAQLSLGKGATQEQIALAGQYAAKTWDTANAIKAQAAAQKLLPETRENASYQQDMKDLKTALDGKRITQQQYNQTSEQLEAQHQANLAKIRSQQVVNPTQQALAEVDPVQQLANQHAQELALIQQFEQQGVLAHQNALALKNAADTQYEQQRTAAQWEILSQQSLGYNMLTSAVDAFSGNASNAITGLLTGTMSAQEAMKSLGNTILNSVINSIVQVGVEMLKNFIIGQTIGAASTANGMIQAALLTNAWTPAAYAASVATGGAAAKVGAVAYGSGLATSMALSTVSGARYNGGPVSAGGLYQVGEKGKPEIYQASTGKQYMIPGDNGKVISNKDMQGGGGLNVQVVINNQASNAEPQYMGATQNDGNYVLEFLISDAERNGPYISTLQSTLGLSRKANGAF
ncbi:phage tape measure protein [Klebsiella pneumoniae]|nr:phage tape measure protein [Klebsiella pneumoniae]